MDPLRHVGRTSSELPPSADSSAGPSQRPTAGPATGVRAEVRVLADLGEGAFAVRLADRSVSVLVHSARALPVGEAVSVVIRSPERPPVLVAVPDAAVDRGAAEAARAAARTAGVPFEPLLGGRAARTAQVPGPGPLAQVPTGPRDVARGLLLAGTPIPADAIRTTAGSSSLALAGTQLAVHVDGPAAPPGGVYAVQRAARPAQVEVVGTAATAPDAAPPTWLAPLLHVLADNGGRAPDAGRLLRQLARALDARAASAPGATPAAEKVARERLAAALRTPRSGSELAERLARGGALFEREARRSLGASPAEPGRVSELGADLRAVLGSLARTDLPASVRELVARALEGLTANALLVHAREQVGEPPWYPLPVLDGDDATTAWLRWRRTGGRGEGDDAGIVRAELAVEFSATGPVHVDAAIAKERIAVRIAVADEAVLARVRAHTDRLSEQLAANGRAVLFGASLAAPEDLRVDADRPPVAPGGDASGQHWVDAVG